MKLPRRTFLQLAAGAAALPTLSRGAWAENYPSRPVRVIVPYAPAGPTDTFARLISQKLSEDLGHQFFIENIPGAGGNIGMGRGAKAAPDGYTLIVVGLPLAINPSLYGTVSFDPVKDFDPVTLAVTSQIVMAVNPSLPAQTVKDAVALISANPGKYSYASPGAGTPPHLVGELFRLSLKLDLVHVPFNGGGPPIAATIAGHTPISFGTLPPAVPQIKDGKLRALAVTSRTRTPILPDVPTMAEAGYVGIEGESWFAVITPAGTPSEIVALLNREINRIIALPDIRMQLTALGYEPVGTTPEEFAAQIKADIEKWGKVIREAKIRAE